MYVTIWDENEMMHNHQCSSRKLAGNLIPTRLIIMKILSITFLKLNFFPYQMISNMITYELRDNFYSVIERYSTELKKTK